MDDIKIPIKLVDGSMQWVQIELQKCFIQYVILEHMKRFTANNNQMRVAFSVNERVDGEVVTPNDSGIEWCRTRYLTVVTTGGGIQDCWFIVPMINYEVKEPRRFWLGAYLSIGESDDKACFHIKISKIKLAEVV